MHADFNCSQSDACIFSYSYHIILGTISYFLHVLTRFFLQEVKKKFLPLVEASHPLDETKEV